MRPVIERSKLIERDVADERVTLVIEDGRDVARHPVVLRIHSLCDLPCLACVPRVGGVSIVLKHRKDLLRILWVHRNAGLCEISGRRSQSEDVGLRRLWQLLAMHYQTCSKAHEE